MSFFVSAPFEGQAVILNDSYVVQDTIIMRIDCDVTKTEYIGYGSDPSDSLNTGEEGSSDFQDLGNGTFGFDPDGGSNPQLIESIRNGTDTTAEKL